MKRSYNEVIDVSPRFARSVNLERDLHAPGAIDGYVLTATALNILARISTSLRGAGRHRAWTLTGPYGSGKSAFAVFIANLLGPHQQASPRLARQALASESPELARDLFDRRRSGAVAHEGFCPVVLTAGAEPIATTLIRALLRDISPLFSGYRPVALKRAGELLDGLEAGVATASREIVSTVQDLATALQRSGKAQGLLIVIDELGKFLEFAARNPDLGDIFLLQLLAESTAGFETPGLLLFTILHQSFDRYVAGLRPSVRDEWAKVQGRFDDVAFQESPDEFLILISHAIRQKKDALTTRLRVDAKRIAEESCDLELPGPSMPRQQLIATLQRCAPLHPVAVLVLARLCRKFGQNQRSLFSFLVSRELKGFLSFLDQPLSASHLPFFGIEDLYDYVTHSLGSGLSIGESATRWAEVQSTLEKCAGAGECELRLIKAVGLLSAVGAYGELKPSPQVLELALGHEAVHTATKRLTQRSVLVYRKHSNSFGFWEGSDVDLELCVSQARKNVPEFPSTAGKLRALWEPRAIVAKRHSVRTGTLRYFQPRFVEATELSHALAQRAEADGSILYLIPTSTSDALELGQLIASSELRNREDVLVAVPKNVDALKEALREVELLRWVEKNTPELQGDTVARRELRSRIATADTQLSAELNALFSPTEKANSRTAWYYRGMPVDVSSPKEFSLLLSDVCDRFYHSTPVIQNELINRRSLSSAAAAARRNLIEAMITRSNVAGLGFTGTPPEVSMYSSVLAAAGIHRESKTGFEFGAPSSGTGLIRAWTAVEEFFESCELHKRPVIEMFSLLQRDPYGMKMGPIPVLFCAAVLAHDADVALYENGIFVPDLTTEMFERLLRTPEKFELRRYCIEGVRREVFNQFATLLESPGAAPTPKETLVEVVRPLFRFFNRLPAYSRQTRSLSDVAVAVRESLFSAREPDALLFDDLPRACGFAPFSPSGRANDEVSEFFSCLRRALLELQRAYDDLLSSAQQMLLKAFGTSGTKGREVIRFRARSACDHAIEPRLRAFLMHLVDEELEDVAWIEAVATLLVGRPPRNWNDADKARYEVTLSELTRNFRHIEALVEGMRNRGVKNDSIGEVIRIGVTDRYSKDLEAVVVLEPQAQDALAESVLRIEEALQTLDGEVNASIALAALGIVCRKYLADIDQSSVSKKSSTQEAYRG